MPMPISYHLCYVSVATHAKLVTDSTSVLWWRCMRYHLLLLHFLLLHFCNMGRCKNETKLLHMPVFGQAIFHHLSPQSGTTDAEQSSSMSDMPITGVPGLDDSFHLGIPAVFFQHSTYITAMWDSRGGRDVTLRPSLPPLWKVELCCLDTRMSLLHIDGKIIDSDSRLRHEIGHTL